MMIGYQYNQLKGRNINLIAKNIQNVIFSIDFSSFPTGIYFAIIDTDKGRSTKKILLSK